MPGSEKNGSSSEKSSEKTTVITTKKTTEKIVRLMKSNPYITNKELAEVCGITEDGVYQNTQKLKKNNRIRRIGGDKGGYWAMPAIIADTFDYDDIVRVLDLDEAFVQHQVDARTLNELIRIPYQFIAMQYGQNSYISILR